MTLSGSVSCVPWSCFFGTQSEGVAPSAPDQGPLALDPEVGLVAKAFGPLLGRPRGPGRGAGFGRGVCSLLSAQRRVYRARAEAALRASGSVDPVFLDLRTEAAGQGKREHAKIARQREEGIFEGRGPVTLDQCVGDPHDPVADDGRARERAPIRGDEARAKEDEPDGGAEAVQGASRRLAVPLR